MRRDLGNTVSLLGQSYSVSHKAASFRLKGREGDLNDKNSPTRGVGKSS